MTVAAGPPQGNCHAAVPPAAIDRCEYPPIRADPRASAIINLGVQSRAICAHYTVAHAVGHLLTCRIEDVANTHGHTEVSMRTHRPLTRSVAESSWRISSSGYAL
jgi:hypothetical protein